VLSALLLAIGLALLLGGGELTVRGAAALARELGVSALTVGLTIVAFGTSAPELAVNTLAALEGRVEISFGNVVGSNLANVGLILAIAALVRPLAVQGIVISREIPMMLLATAAAVVITFDRGAADAAVFDRSEGALLLLFFGVFVYYTVREALRGRRADPLLAQASGSRSGGPLRSLLSSALVAALGLVLLTGGGHLTVEGAVGLAEVLGVPSSIIALVLIAVGTSLPELVTSVVASYRGQTDLAVGNIVGSNIFNLLFVLGITASLHPVPVPERGALDIVVMSVLSLALLPLALRYRNISRPEGAALLLAYAAYVGWRLTAL